MRSFTWTWKALLVGPAAILAVAGIGLSQPAATGPAPLVKFRLPDAAFDGLIQEMNKNLQEEFASNQGPWDQRLRSSALMIALATQHRMANKQGDRRQLATIRDAALRLARAIDVETPKNDFPEAKKQMAVLETFPNIKTDPNAITEIFRLKGTFDQEDIDFHFQRKRGKNGIERDLMSIVRGKKIEVTVEKLEMDGYKVFLLAGMLREFDDHIPPQKVEQRKEWVAHATEAQYLGWDLAEAARSKNADRMKAVATRLDNVCIKCHEKFRW